MSKLAFQIADGVAKKKLRELGWELGKINEIDFKTIKDNSSIPKDIKELHQLVYEVSYDVMVKTD